ncbi:hypothetical protein [Nocardia sp. NPDC050435]|uniref:hypothetical protein n=1 Tax=Nocardia sp. NPDC050435 TaxID=3155040 RepID=UPI0033C9BA11
MDEPALRGPSRPAIHEHLLKTAQNLSAERHDVQRQLDQARHTLAPVSAAEERDWQRRLTELAHLRDIVVEQATDIGVPATALDTVLMRGEQGRRWQRNQPTPRADTGDRLHLVNGLLAHVRRYNNMAAIARAYEQRFGDSAGTASMYHRAAMDALHERIGAVAYALALSPTEREFVWGHSEYIVATMTTHYLDGDAADLVARWDSDATGANWQREYQQGEPLRAAGITREAITAAGQLPPTPYALITALGSELSIRDHTASAPERGGSAISSAIEAADPSTDPTDPAGVEPDPPTGPDPAPPGLDP